MTRGGIHIGPGRRRPGVKRSGERLRQRLPAAALALFLASPLTATAAVRAATPPVPPDPVEAAARLVLHPRPDAFAPGAPAYAVPPDMRGRIRAYAAARRAALAIADPIDRSAALAYVETRFQQDMGRLIDHAELNRINAVLNLR